MDIAEFSPFISNELRKIYKQIWPNIPKMGEFKANSLEDFTELNIPLKEDDPILYAIVDQTMQNMRYLDNRLVLHEIHSDKSHPKTLNIELSEGQNYVTFSITECLNGVERNTPEEFNAMPGFYVSRNFPDPNPEFQDIAKDMLTFIVNYYADKTIPKIDIFELELFRSDHEKANYTIKRSKDRTLYYISDMEHQLLNAKEKGEQFKILTELYLTFDNYARQNHSVEFYHIGAKIFNLIDMLYDNLLFEYTLEKDKDQHMNEKSFVHLFALSERTNLYKLSDAAKENISSIKLEIKFPAA